MGLGSSTSSRSTAESGKCTADLQVATDTIKRLQESLDAGNHRWKEEMASAMKQITVLQQTIAEKQSEYQKSTDQLQQLLPCPQDLIKATQQNEVSKAEAQLWMDKYNTELEPAKARLQDLETKQLTGLIQLMTVLEIFLILSGRFIVNIIKRNPFQTRLFFSEQQWPSSPQRPGKKRSALGLGCSLGFVVCAESRAGCMF
jgi:FtsZ-interacting cell division protein ZipA